MQPDGKGAARLIMNGSVEAVGARPHYKTMDFASVLMKSLCFFSYKMKTTHLSYLFGVYNHYMFCSVWDASGSNVGSLVSLRSYMFALLLGPFPWTEPMIWRVEV